MPLPKPKPGEQGEAFLSRCMANSTMRTEYPDARQRFAVCESQLEQRAAKASRMDRRRELAIRLRLSAQLERSYARRYRALFNKYAKAAAQGYKDGKRRGAITALGEFTKDLRPIVYANIIAAANLIGRRTMDAFGKARKEAPSEFEAAIVAYLTRYGMTKVTGIYDTTAESILDAILAGELDGEPVATIARRIQAATGGAVARNRALTIAITETHSASTYASQEAAKATGLTLEKEWVSAEDSRTRPTHIEADGQRVGMDEPFNVGGYELQYPGDPSGPPEETIRCRCIEIYHED
jgi:uncharacterized protein with gpF-like domain